MKSVFKNVAISLLSKAVDTSANSIKTHQNPVSETIKLVYKYPFKLTAAFLMAPYLAWCIARRASDPARRRIAGVGLFLAVIAAWLAGTLIGSFAGSMLIASGFGLFWGISFFVGTTISAVLSVTFSAVVLNATAYLFFQLSSAEVVEHLRSLSDPEDQNH